MDINLTKLERLITFINDDGILTADSVAQLLKARVENTTFLRAYVEKAAEDLKQPEILTAFDLQIAQGKVEEPAAAAPTQTPVTDEVASKPEAPVRQPARLPVQTEPSSPFTREPKTAPAAAATPAPATAARAATAVVGKTPDAPVVGTTATAQAPGGFSGLNFRYRAPDGTSTDLVVVHVGEKSRTVLLEKKPDAEVVTVTLRGQSVELNLTRLRTLSAGDDFETAAGTYTVATLLVIADAAKA